MHEIEIALYIQSKFGEKKRKEKNIQSLEKKQLPDIDCQTVPYQSTWGWLRFFLTNG